jgi:hypothetical protein
MTHSTNVRKSDKSDNIKHYLLVAEQVILYSVIVAGMAFYGGTQHQAKQDASTKAAIEKAVKAATTPASVVAQSK